jgi:hypothetical protein
MDVIGFLCVSLGSSTVQLHDSLVADAYAHVQRLVPVIKMATALPKNSVLLYFFCGQKDSMQRMFINVSSLWWEVFVT